MDNVKHRDSMNSVPFIGLLQVFFNVNWRSEHTWMEGSKLFDFGIINQP